MYPYINDRGTVCPTKGAQKLKDSVLLASMEEFMTTTSVINEFKCSVSVENLTLNQKSALVQIFVSHYMFPYAVGVTSELPKAH